MVLYIVIIYAILILIVAPLWLLIDTNFKSMLLLEEGKNAEIASQNINDTMSITASSMWYLTQHGNIHFNNTFYDQYHLRKRPIKLEVLMRCLSPDSRHLINKLHLTENGNTITNQEISIHLPNDSEWHTFGFNAYDAPETVTGVRRVGTISLLDDLKKAEAEQEEIAKKEEDILKKNNMLITMGEEIGEPLDNIINYSKLLCVKFNALSQKERRTYGNTIIEETDKLLSFLEGEQEHIIQKEDE